MRTILHHAMRIYEEDRDISCVWTYLNMLIRMGTIEEGTAEQIAYMIEEGDR